MIIKRVCPVCAADFTYDTHSRKGKYPIYCPNCKSTYSQSSLGRRAAEARLMNSDPLGYLDGRPSQDPDPSKIIHPDFINYRNRQHIPLNEIKVIPLKETFRIVPVCDHIFKYAAGEFNVELNGKLVKHIKISIGPGGFNVSASDREEEAVKA